MKSKLGILLFLIFTMSISLAHAGRQETMVIENSPFRSPSLHVQKDFSPSNPFNVTRKISTPLLSVAQSTVATNNQIATDYKLTASVGTIQAWLVFLTHYGDRTDNFYVQLANAALQKITGKPTQKSILKAKVKPPEIIGACLHKDVILKLARHVLDKRLELNRFRIKSYGATSAYLLIRYGKLKHAAILKMLKPLSKPAARTKARGAEDLTFAYLAHNDGLEAAFRFYPADKFHVPAALGFSSLRQILLAGLDNRLIERWKKDPKNINRFSFQAANVLYDQPDAIKLKIAHHLEQNGLNDATFYILLSMSQHKDLNDFIKRHSNDKELETLSKSSMVYASGLTALHNTGWAVVPGRTKEQNLRDQKFYTIMRAAIFDADRSFLMTVWNQTGETEKILEIARGIIADVESGNLNPRRDPASGWIAIYHKMVSGFGRKKTDSTLSSFTLIGNQTALQAIQFAMAADALRPYLNRVAAPPKNRPANIGDQIDWNRWMTLANQIYDRENVSTSPDDHIIAAELLYQAGKFDLLLKYFRTIPAAVSVPIAQKLAQRLDRRCSAHTHFPGGALLLGGITLYRFNN